MHKKRVYSQDLLIELKVIAAKEENVTLKENNEVQTLNSLRIGLRELHQQHKHATPYTSLM